MARWLDDLVGKLASVDGVPKIQVGHFNFKAGTGVVLDSQVVEGAPGDATTLDLTIHADATQALAGNLSVCVWNPAVEEDTELEKSTFEACVAALLARDGFGLLVLHGFEQTGYDVVSAEDLDLEKRIAIVSLNTSNGGLDETRTIEIQEDVSIIDPWFILARNGRIKFGVASDDSSSPMVLITATSGRIGGRHSFFAEEVVWDSGGYPGGAAGLRVDVGEGVPVFDAVNCFFEGVDCVEFSGFTPIVNLRGDRTEFVSEQGAFAAAPGGVSGALTLNIEGFFRFYADDIAVNYPNTVTINRNPLLMADSPIEGARTIAFGAELDNGDVDGAVEIDFTLAQKQRMRLTGDITDLTFEFPEGTASGFILLIEQDGTGGHGITFGSGQAWAAGDVSLASAADALTLWSIHWTGSDAIVASIAGISEDPTVALV